VRRRVSDAFLGWRRGFIRERFFLSSVDYSLRTYANLGSHIDFVLDAGAANDDNCDSSIFTARIDTEDPNLVVVADSVADWSFSGAQGERNWFYGYYNKTADPVPGYQTTNFIPFLRNDGPAERGKFLDGHPMGLVQRQSPWDENRSVRPASERHQTAPAANTGSSGAGSARSADASPWIGRWPSKTSLAAMA